MILSTTATLWAGEPRLAPPAKPVFHNTGHPDADLDTWLALMRTYMQKLDAQRPIPQSGGGSESLEDTIEDLQGAVEDLKDQTKEELEDLKYEIEDLKD